MAQPAGEKAMKALWYWHDVEPWGHSILKLVREIPPNTHFVADTAILHAASDLDKYYIPTRYPNGLPALTPHEVYGERDSSHALDQAKLILNRVASIVEAPANST